MQADAAAKRASRRRKRSHPGAVRKLILGMEGFEHRPRYTLFVVLFVYALMGTALFYTFELVGYLYQHFFTEDTYSGPTKRFIGLWLVVCVTTSTSFVYLIGTFVTLRCCPK